MKSIKDITIGIVPKKDYELLEDEYLKDGNIYCKKCNTSRTCIMKDGKKVKCLCECQVKDRDELLQKEKDKKRMDEIKKIKEKSLLGERYKDVTFENTKTGFNEFFDNAYNRCLKFCENYKNVYDNGFGIYLYGGSGTGKTHLMACMINYLTDHYQMCLSTSISQIIKNILETYDYDNDEKESNIIEEIKNVDFLFIDDIGTEILKKNDREIWTNEKLYDIINARYNSRKPTVFTSNYSLVDLIHSRGMNFKTVDRIGEMTNGARIEMKGNSYRMHSKRNLPF